MIPYLSCDWGTSSFRLSLVDAENFGIIATAATNEGILATYNSWTGLYNGDPETRIPFYLNIINEQIKVIEQQLERPLTDVPLLISGMASASIGMKPLPYLDLPFAIDGSTVRCELIAKSRSFLHDTLLISGVKSIDDVMRGEETQLIGMFPEYDTTDTEKLFLLPGTHSKHILVSNRYATGFKTYMTGEFFDLLSKKSILHTGIEEDGNVEATHAKDVFKTAVIEGAKGNLLHACFKVRTNSLFDKLDKATNYHYLSGLLIGAELGELAHNDTIEIYLCCGTKLKLLYETALEALGLGQRLKSTSSEVLDKAAIKGQYKIYEKYLTR